MSKTGHDPAALEQATATYAIVLQLTPAFSRELARPGVMEAIAVAARNGNAPSAETLMRLGQSSDFASLFVRRLQYLVDLKKAGVLRAAGPFAGLCDGMYLCTAPNEAAARRVIEEDPLYIAGLIARDYRIEHWLVAI